MKLIEKSLIMCNPTPVYDLETVSENHNFCLANGVVVHNSKDIADAVCGGIFSCYQDLEHASKLSNKYKAESYLNAIKNRSEVVSDDTFTRMIHGMYSM